MHFVHFQLPRETSEKVRSIMKGLDFLEASTIAPLVSQDKSFTNRPVDMRAVSG